MNTPLKPAILLNTTDSYPYSFRRVIIESVALGTDVFISEGELSKSSVVPAPGMMPQINMTDNRTFEGWRHED